MASPTTWACRSVDSSNPASDANGASRAWKPTSSTKPSTCPKGFEPKAFHREELALTTTPTDFVALGAPSGIEDRVRTFSTFASWVQTDPVGAFAEMREHTRLGHSEEFGGFWVPTRYE